MLNRLDNETFKEQFNFRPRTIEETKYALLESPWFQRQKWFFAVLDNQHVGYAGVGIDEGLNKEKNVKWGWILDIGILKPFRRKGIGKRLMLHGMQLLKSFGMEHALLYVDDLNPTNAIKLYENLGFKVLRKNIVYQLSFVLKHPKRAGNALCDNCKFEMFKVYFSYVNSNTHIFSICVCLNIGFIKNDM